MDRPMLREAALQDPSRSMSWRVSVPLEDRPTRALSDVPHQKVLASARIPFSDWQWLSSHMKTDKPHAMKKKTSSWACGKPKNHGLHKTQEKPRHSPCATCRRNQSVKASSVVYIENKRPKIKDEKEKILTLMTLSTSVLFADSKELMRSCFLLVRLSHDVICPKMSLGPIANAAQMTSTSIVANIRCQSGTRLPAHEPLQQVSLIVHIGFALFTAAICQISALRKLIYVVLLEFLSLIWTVLWSWAWGLDFGIFRGILTKSAGAGDWSNLRVLV